METLNLYSRKILFGVVIVAVVLAVAIVGVAKRDQGGSPPTVSPTVSPSDQNVSMTTLAFIEYNQNVLKLLTSSSSIAAATANWKEYKDSYVGFSIKYPADLIAAAYYEGNYPLRVGASGFFFERLIPFETYDACSATGKPDVKPLTAIPDFELGVRVVPQSILENITGDTYASDLNVIDAAERKLIFDNFIAERMAALASYGSQEVGPFKGFFELHAVESCGYLRYYVPLKKNLTLIVEKPIPFDSLQEGLALREAFESMKSINPRVKKFAEAQSHYPPIDREKLIYQILSTFRLLGR